MTSAMEVSKRSRKVLIADDDPGILRFLANRCTKMGLEVQTATNGLQALVMAGRSHPDVLIVDINMPELDGLSVTMRLLQPDKRPLEVIVITASSYPETIERCDGFGAFHARKGLELWDRVRSALNEIFPEMAAGTVEDGTPVPHVKWQRPRVLVVDGDPEVGKFLVSRLAKVGVDMLLAYDAAHAYRMACCEEPSVIMLGYPMLNGDAHYLLSRLRSTAKTSKTPVFVMSADNLDDATKLVLIRDFCDPPGAVQYFKKSLDTQELFAALQKFCGFMRP